MRDTSVTLREIKVMDPVPGMIRNDPAKNRSFSTDGSV